MDCENNQLQQLPTEIGALRKLTWVILDNNKITHLPHSVGGLVSLERYEQYTKIIKKKNKNINNLIYINQIKRNNETTITM